MSAPSTPHDAAPPAKGDAPGSGNIRDLIFQLEEQAALKHQRQLQAAEGEVAVVRGRARRRGRGERWHDGARARSAARPRVGRRRR